MEKSAYRAILCGLIVLLAMTATAPVQGQTDPAAAPSEMAPSETAPSETAQASEPTAPVEEPKPELERPTVWGEPTAVEVLIYVIDIDEVNSANQSFSASVYVEAHWKIPALRHEGPGPLHRAWTEVWTPRLTIVNQQQAWRAFPESVEILPDGEVIYRQKFWGHFSQPQDLRAFPQDQQKLTIHIVAAGLQESEVRMVSLRKEDGKESGIAQAFSLPDFDVLSWKAESRSYNAFEGHAGAAGFQMEIEVRRRMTYFLVKVIVPLCLIVIMSWVPRWIDPREIGANLGISTTSFLTLIAYLFAITVLLPRVSYITHIDRFILLSTMMVFAGLLHTVLSTALIRRERAKRVERINRWSRAIYPVVLLLVLAISFEV
jgi:hypothetical protein